MRNFDFSKFQVKPSQSTPDGVASSPKVGAKSFTAAFLALPFVLGSPLGRAVEQSETERARMRNLAHSLALSVTFGDSSPRGRAIGISVRLAQNEKKISFVKA